MLEPVPTFPRVSDLYQVSIRARVNYKGRPQTPSLTTRAIIEAVAADHNLTYDDIMGRSREQHVANARHEAVWTVKQARPHLSLPQLARIFKRANHTTILHSIRRHQATVEGRVYRKTRKVPG